PDAEIVESQCAEPPVDDPDRLQDLPFGAIVFDRPARDRDRETDVAAAPRRELEVGDREIPACRENRKGHDPTQPTQPTYPTSYGATHIRTPSCTNPTCPSTGTPTSSSRPDLPSAGYRAPTWARKRERSDSGIAIPPTRIVVSTKRTAP